MPENLNDLSPMDLGQMLLGGEAPQVDEAQEEAQEPIDNPQEEAQEHIPVEPQAPQVQEAPQPQGLTREEYEQMLNQAIGDKLAPIEEQLRPKPQEEEQDAGLEELKKRLGLDAYDAKIKAQQELLDQQQALIAEQAKKEAMRDEMAKQSQIQADVSKFKEGKSENAETIVMEELKRIGQNNPQLAAQFDNPVGWDLIYQAKVGQAVPTATPDPIIPTGNQTSTPSETAFERAKKGHEVSQIDLGKELLAMVGSR